MGEVFARPVESSPAQPRQPREPKAVGDTGYERSETDVPVPFTNYSDVHNKTYTEEYFNIESNGINGKGIETIENFIKEKIESLGLQNSTEVYDRLLEEIFSNLGISEDEEIASKFFKTHTYIGMMEKQELYGALKDRESLDERIDKLIERRK